MLQYIMKSISENEFDEFENTASPVLPIISRYHKK